MNMMIGIGKLWEEIEFFLSFVSFLLLLYGGELSILEYM